ncbi:MAG: response regulator [Anaerobacillus sp.]|uniref:response regulator n=1 Tax=Anaerobacillus sp. TaxID=1872506 RepID=UPI003918CBC8
MSKNQTKLFVINEDLEFHSFLTKHVNAFTLYFYNNQDDLLKQLYLERPDCLVLNIDQLSVESETSLQDVFVWSQSNFTPTITVMNRFEQKDRTKYLSCSDSVFNHPLKVDELLASIHMHTQKRAQFLAHSLVDSLTTAYNSHYLRDELQRQLNDMKRSHEPLTLVYLETEVNNVNTLREIQVVKSFVTCIKNSIRPTDFLGQYGPSNGFALLLPKTVKEDARKLLNRLTKIVLEKGDILFEKSSFSFSAKIVEVTEHNVSPEECLSALPFTNKEEGGQIVEGSLSEDGIGLKRLNIAIIDDDRLIRELLKHQLEDIAEDEYKLEIKTFAEGEEFFSDPWHRQNERFILIIDRIMPKMDGLEILRKIRAEYDRKRYLCFMLTSRGSEADVALAIQKGANDYMTKPFSLKELEVRIKRLLRGSR